MQNRKPLEDWILAFQKTIAVRICGRGGKIAEHTCQGAGRLRFAQPSTLIALRGQSNHSIQGEANVCV
jgi:hypothetical protein